MGSAGPKGEGAARAPQPGTARRQRDWASPVPSTASPGRGSPLRALRQMLHNADPLPSAKCPGPHAAQESGSGAQGSDAERDGPGMGGSRIPDVAGRERGIEMLSRRLPTPPRNPHQTPAGTPAGGAVRGPGHYPPNSAELAMGRGNRVGAGHQNAPRGSPRRPGPTWAVVAHEAGGRLRSALAARGPSCARHGRHTASWGVGPPESVTVVLPDQAAFCSLLCCLGFWEGAQALLLEARRVTPLLCNPCFSLSRRPAARLLHKEAQDCLHLKTSILNFLFHSPPPTHVFL